jgi:Ca2+-binding RTX toxin-like protein
VTGTVNVTEDTATLTGDAANDNIVIGVIGANLSHNVLAGFNSAIDFDSTADGDQTLSSGARLTINSGDRDGFDRNDGEAGVDETLITNGTADDKMSVAPLAGGRTLFSRSNTPFSVDMGAVEKLSISSFAGKDKLQTAPGVTLPMTVDAGTGDDDITTGDASDRLVGDRGDDTLNAGAGDDTMVWSNGDGTDNSRCGSAA